MLVCTTFLALLCVAESRVSFEKSEVLDDVDLRGTNTATFRCSAGCRVYSPTRNGNIMVVNSAGNELKSLLDLANLDAHKSEVYELPASTNPYKLLNKGAANPSFLLYAVEKGAANYDTTVLTILSANQITVYPKEDTLLTVLSSSGAVRFDNFKGDYTNALPAVYAMGADSIGSSKCRPVYQAIDAPSVLKTGFPVYSPIATIDFKKTSNANTVIISGDAYSLSRTGQDVTAVYSSPGYVGCSSVGDSLYTSLPQITSIESSFKVTDSNGLSAVVDGDINIASKADAVKLTVNNDVQDLYGKQPYSKTYDATSFQIAVKWTKKEGSTDRFAMQIDVMSKVNVQTTTKSGQSLSIVGSLMALVVSKLLRL